MRSSRGARMLKLSDLALRSDLRLGPILVSASRRLIEGPAGSINVEPLTMQVFVILLDAVGAVVTRTSLFEACWGGAYVGDDSLNRVIGKIRRAGDEVAPGLISVETIPRTGYRLTVPLVEENGTPATKTQDSRFSRRNLVLAGAAGAALLGGAGLYRRTWVSADERFDLLMKQARTALYQGSDENAPVVPVVEEAVRLRPNNASALGLLALVTSMAPVGTAGALPASHEKAADYAKRALSIDPKEPSALLARYELDTATLDWITRDKRLRQIVAIDPGHIPAISELVALLQSAGLNRESWNWNERAIAVQPQSRELHARRAMKFWIAERYDLADKEIDQARDFWPSSPFLWWVRFLILATTGRATAAKAMFDAAPPSRPPPWSALWRSSLPAMIDPTPSNLAQARQGCDNAAKASGGLAIQAVMILGALKQIDAAYDICDGFLLWRGSVVRAGDNRARQLGSDSGWRMSVQWLFTPPCAGMRADERFPLLCKAIGLSDYWKARGVSPDYLKTLA